MRLSADSLSGRSGPFILFAHDDQDLHGRMVQRDKARKGSCQASSSWRAGTMIEKDSAGAIDTAPVRRCFERGRSLPWIELPAERGNSKDSETQGTAPHCKDQDLSQLEAADGSALRAWLLRPLPVLSRRPMDYCSADEPRHSDCQRLRPHVPARPDCSAAAIRRSAPASAYRSASATTVASGSRRGRVTSTSGMGRSVGIATTLTARST
jgi:hypothetical protein